MMWAGSSGNRLKKRAAKKAKGVKRKAYALPKKRRGKRTNIRRCGIPYDRLQNFTFQELSSIPSKPNQQNIQGNGKKPRTIFEKCMAEMKRRRIEYANKTRSLPLEDNTTKASEAKQLANDPVVSKPVDTERYGQTISPNLEAQNFERPHNTDARNNSMRTFVYNPSKQNKHENFENQSAQFELNKRVEKSDQSNGEELPHWKKVLDRYPSRPVLKPIILEHSPPLQETRYFFDSEILEAPEVNSTNQQNNNILFIDNDRWMTGKSPKTNTEQGFHTTISQISQVNELDEDQAFLKGILVSIRSMQEELNYQENLLEDEICTLDANISPKELIRIFDLCLLEKNRDIGLQLMYEVLEHEELITSKLSVMELRALDEKIFTILGPESSQPLLSRIRQYLHVKL